MKKLLLVLMTVLMVGCNPQEPTGVEWYAKDIERYNNITAAAQAFAFVGEIYYKRDDKTGLCYAFTVNTSSRMFNVYDITNVPCTPKVLEAIERVTSFIP